MMKKILLLALPVLVMIGCAKEKSLENGGDQLPVETSWQFKDTTALLNGSAITYSIDATGRLMEYMGTTPDGSGIFTMQVKALSGVLKTGVYQSKTGEVVFNYTSGGTSKYAADNVDSIGENLTVTILSVDSLGVIGFFAGTARTDGGLVKTIAEGKFNYRRPAAPPVDSSQGTLGSAMDTCTGVVLAGEYKKLVPLNNTNTATVNVNVTKVGAFHIGTDTVNGFYFNKTGNFTTTGPQTVVLAGAGTPLDSALTSFKVRYGSNVCGFVLEP